MSDTNPITIETQPVKTPTEQILKSTQENIKKPTNIFDERPVILTIENLQKPDKPESAGSQKESENLKIFRDVRTVSVSYSEQGLPVVKFLDSKGNTVLQIPPEEYLRLKEETKAKSGEKIPDIVNKKI
ncbi:MAG: hypothetical protein N3A62_09765 [Thermodesulfovibrionales bacterium]|nr:hypothetical protein [Thermodesulfovibrionales bacterium]